METAARVLMVIGAVLLLAGGVLYLVLGEDDRPLAVLVVRVGIGGFLLAIPLAAAAARQRSS